MTEKLQMNAVVLCPYCSEIARNVVESQRLLTLIDYATAAPFTIGLLETALAIEDSSNGI